LFVADIDAAEAKYDQVKEEYDAAVAELEDL